MYISRARASLVLLGQSSHHIIDVPKAQWSIPTNGLEKRRPFLGGLMKNWDRARLATVAEIGASLGVIISVIYLGIQIQGSNKAASRAVL